MAQEEAEGEETEEAPIEGSPIRPQMTGHRVLEMDALGWLIFIALLVVIIPLLPIIVVLLVLSRLFGWGEERTFSWR